MSDDPKPQRPAELLIDVLNRFPGISRGGTQPSTGTRSGGGAKVSPACSIRRGGCFLRWMLPFRSSKTRE
ncbi:MAG: hypothetical protein A2Z13_07685 [Deltaproteobacteria bacterium RBG_16_64_85]|nr:MAG: hypothetical protein A2Z13_07685 [Deltaproteobacteria bacterium RBG_16_64_85]